MINRPSGVLLITPESLEAMFIRRGPELKKRTEKAHLLQGRDESSVAFLFCNIAFDGCTREVAG
jgi:hypothetical protein